MMGLFEPFEWIDLGNGTVNVCMDFDSEYSMFCMYSKNPNYLEELTLSLRQVIVNIESMEEVWRQISAKYKVYVAIEHENSGKTILSYVGITKLSLEERLKQHRVVGKNFTKLVQIDEFRHLYEARGYEEVIEEIMTNPLLNKDYLFINENNSIHINQNQKLYTESVKWAIANMKGKGYMDAKGNLIVLESLRNKN